MDRSPSHGQESSKGKNYKFGLLFSSTVPIGIIMGIFIGYTPGSLGKLISAIFQALAAGTFIHVAFCELIPAELSHTSSNSICDDSNVSVEEKEESLQNSHDHLLHVERQDVILEEPSNRGESDDEHSQRSEFISNSKVAKLREKRIFRILLIFLGFLFMAVITVFIDH